MNEHEMIEAMTQAQDTLLDARKHLEVAAEAARVLGEIDIEDGLWQGFTCIEIDAIAALVRTFTSDAAAEYIIASHGEGDDEGDSHMGAKYPGQQ